MNKLIIFCVIFILIVLSYIIYQNNISENNIERICFKEDCFNLEIADDNLERAKGLMFRKDLCNDCAMLFIFDKEGIHKFWMKNTLIPLDIIWINENLEVIHIAHAVPCIEEKCELYNSPDKNSLYVLELNKEKANEIGLKVGDRMNFEYKLL